MSWFPNDVDTNANAKYLNVKKAPVGQEVRFRILSEPISGMIAWGKQKGVANAMPRPIRRPRGERFPGGIEYQADNQTGELRAPQQFVAFAVYDYAARRVKVMELTQVSIMKVLKEHADSEDWGSPTEYDLGITRKDEQGKTAYSVQAKPKTPLREEAAEAWAELRSKGFSLSELFAGRDPFPAESVDEPTPDTVVDEEPPFPTDDDMPF